MSTACQTCRDRRIKCDSTKPTCQRCIKSKRICIQTGSTVKKPHFSIHDENSYASGQVKRPRGPRSSLTIVRPQFSLQTRALSYYLQCHLMTPKDVPRISGGLSECISSWATSGRMGSCDMVDLALSSMALAVFARTQFHPPAAVEASSGYMSLICVARKRIGLLSTNLSEKDIDSCLLAVSLMGRYENVKHYPTRPPADMIYFDTLPSHSHTDGSMAILKVWYDELHIKQHQAASYIVKHTRRGLLRSCLIRKQPLPEWLKDGNLFGEEDDELLCDRIFVQLINFLHTISMFKRKRDFESTAVQDLYIEICGIEKDLLKWVALIPASCSYVSHTIPDIGPLPQKHFYTATAFSFLKPERAAAWCHYFALFMLFSVIQLRVLSLLRTSSCSSPPSDHTNIDYDAQHALHTSALNSMAANLACSVPFCIDRFKLDTMKPTGLVMNLEDNIKPYLASLAAWPLSIAASLIGVDRGQQAWFKAELGILGTVTGDCVLECASTNLWAVL